MLFRSSARTQGTTHEDPGNSWKQPRAQPVANSVAPNSDVRCRPRFPQALVVPLCPKQILNPPGTPEALQKFQTQACRQFPLPENSDVSCRPGFPQALTVPVCPKQILNLLGTPKALAKFQTQAYRQIPLPEKRDVSCRPGFPQALVVPVCPKEIFNPSGAPEAIAKFQTQAGNFPNKDATLFQHHGGASQGRSPSQQGPTITLPNVTQNQSGNHSMQQGSL